MTLFKIVVHLMKCISGHIVVFYWFTEICQSGLQNYAFSKASVFMTAKQRERESFIQPRGFVLFSQIQPYSSSKPV